MNVLQEVRDLLNDARLSAADRVNGALEALRRAGYRPPSVTADEEGLKRLRSYLGELLYPSGIDPEVYQLPPEEEEQLANEVDPETGRPYDIPLLFPTDPLYRVKYISFMLLKRRAPDTFQAILNWQ